MYYGAILWKRPLLLSNPPDALVHARPSKWLIDHAIYARKSGLLTREMRALE